MQLSAKVPRSAKARSLFDEVIAVCRHAGFSPRIVNEPNFMATVLALVESALDQRSESG